MKKNSLNFIITIILAIILSQFLPWWAIMVAGFLSSIIIQLKRLAIFFVPFFAIALLWMALALSMSSANDYILAKKIGVLLTIGDNPYLLILITGLIGGIATGVAAIFGKQVSSLFKTNNK